jgi:DNA polymerase III subunit beta
MKFVITKNIIENVISSMQPFLEKKDASSITSHIYLEVLNSSLTLKATDYEIGLESTIQDLTQTQDGKATVNGQNLLNIIKRLKESDIVFEASDNSLTIKQNKSNFKLPMYDANEYPSFPKTENLTVLNINNVNLINSLKKITPAVDNNNPKFELNGALIDIKTDKINFVATDTRRLAISHLQNISNEVNQFIIPKKAIIEIQKLFLDEIKNYL